MASLHRQVTTSTTTANKDRVEVNWSKVALLELGAKFGVDALDMSASEKGWKEVTKGGILCPHVLDINHDVVNRTLW